MAINSYFLLYVIMTLFFAFSSLEVSATMGGRKDGLLGGWNPIKDPKDPYVVEIGKFAISQHNKKINSKLQFQRVVKGEQQVVAGMNYKLVIAAKDGAAGHQYEAVVWDQAWTKSRKLTSFKQIA